MLLSDSRTEWNPCHPFCHDYFWNILHDAYFYSSRCESWEMPKSFDWEKLSVNRTNFSSFSSASMKIFTNFSANGSSLSAYEAFSFNVSWTLLCSPSFSFEPEALFLLRLVKDIIFPISMQDCRIIFLPYCYLISGLFIK